MKHRRVFSAPDLTVAQAAVAAARAAGVPDEDVSLIARSDIQLEAIPDDRIDATTDTIPAAIRGAVGGGSTGLLAGLVAVAIPPLGVTIGGVALLAAIGALVGTWSSALMGSAVPNSVRRTFESEIEAGRILVVVDAEDALLPAAHAAVTAQGATALPFDAPSAAT
ncbi:MAG TPA: hypothetical protein VGC30_05525 [Dokdonella sp.]